MEQILNSHRWRTPKVDIGVDFRQKLTSGLTFEQMLSKEEHPAFGKLIADLGYEPVD